MFFHFIPEPLPGTVQLYFDGVGLHAHDTAYFFQALLAFIKQGNDFGIVGCQQADAIQPETYKVRARMYPEMA